jgi:hypothetical protein
MKNKIIIKTNKNITTETKMDKILEDDEWLPPVTSGDWIKTDIFYVNQTFGKIEYSITAKLIKDIQMFGKLFAKNKEYNLYKNDNTDNIKRIFVIENETGLYKIGSTTSSLLKLIKLNLYRYQTGEDNYFKDFGDLKKIKIKLLEFTKGTTGRVDIDSRKNYYEGLILEKSRPINPLKTYELVSTTISDLLKKNKELKKQKCYIYELRDEDKKKFIIGTVEQIDKKKAYNIMKKLLYGKDENIIVYPSTKYTFGLLEDFDYTVKEEYFIRVDFLMYIKNTINNGYNTGYTLFDTNYFDKPLSDDEIRGMTRMLALKINEEIFKLKFTDSTKYENIKGIIYKIETKKDKKKYISYSTKTGLKDTIIHLYRNAISNESKTNKMQKILEINSYDDLSFSVLEILKENSKINIEERTKFYIDKFDTIKNGYNADTDTIKHIKLINKIFK